MGKQHLRAKKAPSRSSGGAPGTYWLWGRHACIAALENPERRVLRILCTPNAATGLLLRKDHPMVETVDPRSIEAHTGAEAVHQGIAIEVAPLDALEIEDILHEERPIIVLDQVTDPHNVGAILRSAAAFGAAAVIQPRDHAAPQGGVMARAASGALDLVPLVYVTNLARALKELKDAGFWVAGLEGEATTALHDAKLGPRTVLVLGAEGKGMRRLTVESCDLLVKLPIDPRMESLNVSNAAAVALYELSRHHA